MQPTHVSACAPQVVELLKERKCRLVGLQALDRMPIEAIKECTTPHTASYMHATHC